jgi:Rhodopirellula transposase DDE domain
MGLKDKLAPFGILNMMTGLLTIMFGVSFETSDFIVDCLERWWDENKEQNSHIKQLVINLDNGPQNSSHRTQFMKRMIEFADKNNLEIVLVYYPPYYSKYNPIERCWGILENHWSATLLDTVETTLKWAKTMTWKGISPVIKLVETVYQKGVRMGRKAFKALANRIDRNTVLPKYYLTIRPQA